MKSEFSTRYITPTLGQGGNSINENLESSAAPSERSPISDLRVSDSLVEQFVESIYCQSQVCAYRVECFEVLQVEDECRPVRISNAVYGPGSRMLDLGTEYNTKLKVRPLNKDVPVCLIRFARASSVQAGQYIEAQFEMKNKPYGDASDSWSLEVLLEGVSTDRLTICDQYGLVLRTESLQK
jgi:hypothetical protein